jgi:hypothetical protein
MKIGFFLIALLAITSSPAFGQLESVTLQLPKSQGWAGERIPFYVELRAPGSFAGTASFSLPQLPRTTILKLGNPVISSKEIEGESWFIQTHEFALFSQISGTLEVPAIEVRFSARNGFTGPPIERQGKTTPAELTIQRPPGVAADTYLLTTEALEVREQWAPELTAVQVGETVTRTIRINAAGMTAMAFPPPPVESPEGVRLYQENPTVSDSIQRGELQGQREDRMTYLFQAPGSRTLPAVQYIWWNPKTQILETLDLESRSFNVTDSNPAAVGTEPLEPNGIPGLWVFAGVLIAVVGTGLTLHPSSRTLARRAWCRLRPPQAIAARHLLSACRLHDPHRAHAAWVTWERVTDLDFSKDPTLFAAVQQLQQQLYSSQPPPSWSGQVLAKAFRQFLQNQKTQGPPFQPSSLPPLNRTT